MSTQTVATDPAASWVFVVDNLNIHCSEGLARWVAKTCGIDQELGKKRQNGNPALTGHAARVSLGSEPPHPFLVLTQAHVVAEPD